jgi:hypothetical protein
MTLQVLSVATVSTTRSSTRAGPDRFGRKKPPQLRRRSFFAARRGELTQLVLESKNFAGDANRRDGFTRVFLIGEELRNGLGTGQDIVVGVRDARRKIARTRMCIEATET